jgi:LacI family transcriptional regulator, repressor for deo operon, udp, cdd, tsx, nupC, and nupG
MVTQTDVARAAGVAQKTVSNVLRGYPHVRPEARERVLRAARELGYRPNHAARSLRTGRSKIMTLALPELDQSYFAELARLIVETAESRGYTVLIAQTLGDRDRELAALSDFGTETTEGIILSPISCTDDDIRSRTGNHPFVLLGEHLGGGGQEDHVGIDNVAAARCATEHLIELGRRTIGFIGSSRSGGSEMAAMREQGYRKALDDAGVPYRPRLVRAVEGYHRRDGFAAVEALLDEPGSRDGLDALFCVNDLLAQGAMRALCKRGIRIPTDVAVVGFDDLEESSYGPIGLTSISPDKQKIAQSAVDQLIERINGSQAAARDQDISFALAVRESTRGPDPL